MSTQITGASTLPQTATEAGIASLAIKDEASALEEIKSKVHYIWNPFADIPLVGPDGPRFRLGKNWNYYGVGVPGEEPNDYISRSGDRLLRCQAYPLWNILYRDTKYNRGKFTTDEGLRGQDFGAQAGLEEVTQFAGVCAADFIERYRDDYGARVLTPFIGMDNEEQRTAEELLKLVQPYAFKLTNLRQEQNGLLEDEETLLFDLAPRGPAVERINGAGLDSTLSAKAHELRKILYSGVTVAANTARVDWADFLKQLNASKMGQSGFKKGPSPYDHHLAFLLGEAVPASIGSGDTLGELTSMFKQVMTREVAGAAPTMAPAIDPNAEARELLAQVRAEREALARERLEVEQRRAAETQQPPPPKEKGGSKAPSK